jgi:ribosomal protein S17E
MARDIGRISLDLRNLIPSSASPEQGMALAARLLDLSPYGYSSVIRLTQEPEDIIDPVSGAVTGTRLIPKYVYSRTGETSTDLGSLITKAEEEGIISYTTLTKNAGRRVNRQIPFGGLMAEQTAINDYLIKAKLRPTGDEARALRQTGLAYLIDGVEVETGPTGKSRVKNYFEIRPQSFSDPKKMLNLREGKTATGEILGLAIQGDDSFNFLEYGLPGQTMKESDIAKLKVLIGAPVMPINMTAAKFDKIEGPIGKLGKRQKGYTSPRQFSIADAGIKRFLSGSGKSTLADATLMVDARAEMLVAALSGKLQGGAGASGKLGKELRSMYDNLGYKFYDNFNIAEQEGLSILDSILNPSDMTESDYRQIGQIMKRAQAMKTSDPTVSVTKHFQTLLKNNRTLSDTVKNGLGLTLDKMEVSVDGVFVINKKHLQKYIIGDFDSDGNIIRHTTGSNKGKIKGQSLVKDYEKFYQKFLVEKDTMSASDVQMMKDLKAEIQVFAHIEEDERTGQVMARMRDVKSLNARIGVESPGSVNPFPYLKGRGRIVDDLADDVSIVIPDVMVKGETGYKEFINFDVLDSKPANAIAPDLQMLLFHQEMFSQVDAHGRATIPNTTRAYISSLQDEMQEIFRTGHVPKHVREKILSNIEETHDEVFKLTFGKHKRSVTEMQREQAKRLNNALLSGNTSDPEVVNMITNYYRREMFSQKTSGMGRGAKAVRILKTPDLFRFDIEAEIPSLQGQNEPVLLTDKSYMDKSGTKRNVSRAFVKTDTSAGELVLSRARIHDHRMLSSGLASVLHQASLGGYDFDDKGLPMLKSYVESFVDRNGVNRTQKRLAFTTFRQPTGPAEFVVNSFLKDQETLNELFSHNTAFMRSLRDMATDTTIDDVARKEAAEVLEYMTSRPTDRSSGQRFGSLHRKFAGIGITKEDIEAGNYYGTKESRLFDESFEFFAEGQRQVDRVIENVYERTYGDGVAEISDKMMNLMGKMGRGGILQLTPEIMQEAVKELSKDELTYLTPAYVRGRFFRLFGEAGAQDFNLEERTNLANALRNAREIDDATVAQMIRQTSSGDFAMSEKIFRENVQLILESSVGNSAKKVMHAEIEGALQLYRSRITFTDEQASNLGGYVNRLMSIGSTVNQMEDINAELVARGGKAQQLATLLDESLVAPFIIPEEAVDFAVNTGTMKILGTDDARVRQEILKSLSLATEIATGEMAPAQVGAILQSLGIKNLNEAGDSLIYELGKRIGAHRAGLAALEIGDIESLAIDPRLYNIKLAHQNAGELLSRGLVAGADLIASASVFTDEERARAELVRSEYEELSASSAKSIGEAVTLSADSRYASAAAQLNAADDAATRINAVQRNAFMNLSPSEIDAFYFRRQGAPMDSEIESMAARIISDNQEEYKNIEEFERAIRFSEDSAETQKTQAQIARMQLGEKIKADIEMGMEKLREQGFADLDELDLMDELERQQRVQKVSQRTIDRLPTMDPSAGISSLYELSATAKLRRDMTMIMTSPGFEESDTYKINQIIDRHMSFLQPSLRTSTEERLANDVGELHKLIVGIAEQDRSGRRRTRGFVGGSAPTLDTLLDGLMSRDDFLEVADLVKMNMDDDLKAAALDAAPNRPLLEANIGGIRKSTEEAQILYQARAKGLQDRYVDPTTGRLSIPQILNTATGGASGSPTPIAGQKYKRITEAISDGTIKQLMDKPYVRGSLMATAALGAFGFIYSARKDHTEEAIQGPPLLPGGSAYDSAYPGNTLNLQNPNYMLPSAQNGVTYRVNVSGDYSAARRFGDSVQSLIPGASSATYYNNIRDLQADPYAQMGSSY